MGRGLDEKEILRVVNIVDREVDQILLNNLWKIHDL